MIYDLFNHAQHNIPPVIKCCTQPEELFKLIASETFDIVFTDIQMPAMNGFELLQKLRSLDVPQAKNIPVIAITARSDMDETDFCTQGFAGCLHKPFNQTELLKFSKLTYKKTGKEIQYKQTVNRLIQNVHIIFHPSQLFRVMTLPLHMRFWKLSSEKYEEL